VSDLPAGNHLVVLRLADFPGMIGVAK